MSRSKKPKASPAQIELATKTVGRVCDHFNVSYRDIRGGAQYPNISRARWFLAILLTEEVHMSQKEAEEIIGTAGQYVAKIVSYFKKKCAQDQSLARRYEDLRKITAAERSSS